MDEGLLDYVSADYQFEGGNPHANGNIISGDSDISARLVRATHEKSGSKENVATSYHAIKFLL